MGYLLRTKSDYRLCYGEPKYRFVVTGNGSYFCADEYQKMVNGERELQCYMIMESENFPLDGWADVCENNRGVVVTKDIAEYLLDGVNLDVDTFVELVPTQPTGVSDE